MILTQEEWEDCWEDLRQEMSQNPFSSWESGSWHMMCAREKSNWTWSTCGAAVQWELHSTCSAKCMRSVCMGKKSHSNDAHRPLTIGLAWTNFKLDNSCPNWCCQSGDLNSIMTNHDKCFESLWNLGVDAQLYSDCTIQWKNIKVTW